MEISIKFQPLFELLDPERSKKYKNIRYVILIGGRGGAKSHALHVWLNQASYKPDWGILFTRYTMVSAEKSVIPEFANITGQRFMNNYPDFYFTRTQVINKQSRTIIDYSGLKPQQNSSTGALKSLSNKNVFILEEAEDCPSFEQFDKVDNSIRTTVSKNIVILVLNQGHISHWIFKEFFREKRDDVMIIETTYLDNLKFLDESFIKKAERVKQRDLRRYKHIYLNEWKTDVDGALWIDRDISPYRITMEEFKQLDIVEAVIGYDPAVTDSEKVEKERTTVTGNQPDEDGIIIAAKCKKGHYYVIGDKSQRGTRLAIAQLLGDRYNMGDINMIVIEKNNGGDFIPSLIKSAKDGKYVRTKTVTATKGKRLRAQPIQALYEVGEVHHVGNYPELEYEMTTWVPDIGLPSPNRMDALVWALSYLKDRKIIKFI